MTTSNSTSVLPGIPLASAPRKTCASCGAAILAKAEICPSCGVRQRSHVSKTALLLLTFFLGGIGMHKFYLGKYWQGIFYLLFAWTGIPSLVALVEFVIYACTSSERLDEKYSAVGGSTVIVLVVVALLAIPVIGIVAAIALPAYQDYTKRASVAEGIVAAKPLLDRVGEVFRQHPADMSCSPEGCPLGAVELASRQAKRISSDRSGMVVVVFDEHAFPAPANRLAFTPMIGGLPADLSIAANAGKSFDWKCGGDSNTTVPARNLPRTCR